MAYDRSYVPNMVRGCRRTGLRHRLGRSHNAFLEIRAQDGRTWHLDLLDISRGGMCFGLEGGEPPMEAGIRLDSVVAHVGTTTFEGMLTIAHATEEFAAGTICGARFEPATEFDRRTLATLLASLGG